ncbi:MAG TPA: helix-hairpin-helix domain-containing protein, partial [Bacteroidia bacterium]|nr:helix-hairpin-helix domain-containing protein [Bacteroidia bacterium]
CSRLLIPSMENETIGYYRLKAETESARLFAVVLKQLLLAPPLGQKNILAIDPGFKSGCKIVCLDKNGRLLHNETIYPHPPQSQQKIASNKISTLVSQYKIDAIAIGDGTAGRETGTFIQRLRFDRKIQVFMVNEDGASVYSATAEARKEFPEYDVTVRGAVSIGRRLMDPLAELIKINPRSLGIGQYQHEIDEMMLNSALDQTIEHCVNTVGVNLETASEKLLTYVSGIGEVMAKKIIDARTNSDIRSRSELKKIKGMGDKTFEMCAGFIRINGDNPLDKSAVHPENYPLVERMAEDIDTTITGLIGSDSQIQKIDITKYVTDEVGLPTLKDIIAELSKPGRDVRGIIKVFEFNSEIKSINDLQPDMLLPGIITNITNFGAFVDIGIKKDGLVHISEISDEFISDISSAVRLNQQVMVKVLSADSTTGRIQFSMKGIQQP